MSVFDRAQPPRATYRLQFNRDFTFGDAAALVDYLAALGASHLYASPFLKARPGSPHGYDIIDHNQLNSEIGGDGDLAALVDRLRERGMGLMLDFVPNHMGVGGNDNAWWLDVLEWGQASPYAEFFDIDWQSPRPDLVGKVLLPVLGDQYGTVLEKGEIRAAFRGRRRKLQHLVLRPSLSDLAPSLCDDPPPRGGCGIRRSTGSLPPSPSCAGRPSARAPRASD